MPTIQALLRAVVMIALLAVKRVVVVIVLYSLAHQPSLLDHLQSL